MTLWGTCSMNRSYVTHHPKMDLDNCLWLTIRYVHIYIHDSMRIGIDASHICFSRGHGLFGPMQCSPSIGGAKEEPNKNCGVWGIENWGCSLSIWKPALGRCRHWWWEVCERFGFLGSLKETHFGGIKEMQIYGSLEGFALQNVLFGSVK